MPLKREFATHDVSFALLGEKGVTDLDFVVRLTDGQSLEGVGVDESGVEDESEGVGVDFGGEGGVAEVLLESLREGVGPDTTTATTQRQKSNDEGSDETRTDPMDDPIPPAR